MKLNLLVLALFGLASLITSLRHIYQFQITEFWAFRFRAMIRDAGILKVLFPLMVILPAKSPRNIAIFAVTSMTLGAYLALGAFLFADNIQVVIPWGVFSYFVVKVGVVLGVVITHPIAKLAREKTKSKAREMAKNSNAVFIGITGSFGKSSVKVFTQKVLGSKHSVVRTRGNRNTDIGVSIDVIDLLKPDTEYFIAEMGAYVPGEIERICSVVKPTFGVLTGLGNQHIDLFGSRKVLIHTKGELLRALPEDGLAIVNCDCDGYEKALRDTKCRVLLYGWSEKADLKIIDVDYLESGLSVEFEYKGDRYNFITKLLAKHSAMNLMPAIAMGFEIGMKYEHIAAAISKIKPIKGKLSIHHGLGGLTYLNDSYNSNVEGFMSAIDVLDKISKEGIAFTHGIYELGKEREASYKKILAFAKDHNVKIFSLDKAMKEADEHGVVEVVRDEGLLLDMINNGDFKSKNLLIEGRFSPDFMRKLSLD